MHYSAKRGIANRLHADRLSAISSLYVGLSSLWWSVLNAGIVLLLCY